MNNDHGPKVSVITICRDDLPGLRATVDSVRSQTYKNIEHIVIDGHSSDGTEEYLRGADGLSWFLDGGRGRYDGMNEGARRATGDLLWFMHAGDQFFRSDTVEHVVGDFAEREWSWAYGLTRVQRSDGAVVAVGGRIPFDRRRFLLGLTIIPHQAAAFSRAFFLSVGPYDEEFGLAADQEHFMRCLTRAEPATVCEILCRFDANGAGSTRLPHHHFGDTNRARRRTGLRVSRLRMLDAVVSTVIGAMRTMLHQVRRLRRSIDAQSMREPWKGQR